MRIVESIRMDVTECSACGEDHSSVVFMPMAIPRVIDGKEFKYVGVCLKLAKDLYMRFVEIEITV